MGLRVGYTVRSSCDYYCSDLRPHTWLLLFLHVTTTTLSCDFPFWVIPFLFLFGYVYSFFRVFFEFTRLLFFLEHYILYTLYSILYFYDPLCLSSSSALYYTILSCTSFYLGFSMVYFLVGFPFFLFPTYFLLCVFSPA